MDDFSTFAMDFGFRSQGKAPPMSRPSISDGSDGRDRPPLFDDVYTTGKPTSSLSDFDYDSIFKTTSPNNNTNYNSNYSNRQVYDKPVYDEDIFDGLPGMKTKSGSFRVKEDENVFATISNEKMNRNYSVDKSASVRVNYDENVFATILNEKRNDKLASSRGSYDDDVFATMLNEKKNGNYSVDKSASDRVREDKNVFATMSNERNNWNHSVENSASSRVSYDDNVFATMLDEINDRNGSVDKLASARVSYDENVFATMLNEKKNRGGTVDKSASSRVGYDENVFATVLDEKKSRNHGDGFDELFGNSGPSERVEANRSNGIEGFDDLLPGFGVTSPQRNSRSVSESSQSKETSDNSTKPTSSVTDDPFVVLESTSAPENSSPKVFLDPLDEISKLGNSANTKANSSSDGNVVFGDIDPLDGFGKFAPAVSSEINKKGAPSRAESNDEATQSTFGTKPVGKTSFRDSTSQSQKMSNDNFQEFQETIFDMPSISTDSRKFGDQMASPTCVNVEFNETHSCAEMSPGSDVHLDSSDDTWLTVSEIPLFTQPMSAPPPSRPPPPIPGRSLKSETGFYHSNARKKGNEFPSSSSYSHYSQSPKSSSPTVKSNMASPIDELENFAMCGTKHYNGEYTDTHGSEEVDTSSSAAASAAAMKEAMDRAEAKFRHAKEVRGRESAKTARNREPTQVEEDEEVMPDEQEGIYRDNEERVQRDRQQKEEEEERKRLEMERERAREERAKGRQAVERAMREARERAAIEARERAAAETRRKSERAAVERAQAEARERATKAAVQRVQAEARERAAAEAKEKAEKAATEARERANVEMRDKAAANAKAEAEARRRAECAAVDRATAEARERAASAAKMNQQKNENAKMNQQQMNDKDLESFFSMNSRPNSAPRPRATSSEPTVDPIFQSKVGSKGTTGTSSLNTSANMRKTSSTTNFVDDLSSIFGGIATSGSDFQEVNGETEERRRARLDRHQRTQERATKALAEKNQRDLQSQRDQEERHRIGATLDIEIKRWAAGKEGNLRALLSTMQYVLWPECGWTPVSLTDLITGASVKKVYRKATLCIHPDKVQQKGANLQQKYIAEKVFDLLKEAWNKFNSEELF